MGKYDVSVFIVTQKKEYINLYDYDIVSDGDGVFVCATNDSLNSDFDDDNSICIYKNLLIVPSCKWQKDKTLIDDIVTIEYNSINKINDLSIKHLNGFIQTYNIMMKDDRNILEWHTPAIMLAYNTTVDFNGKTYHGYLPTITQLIYISKNIEMINKALMLLSSAVFNVVDDSDSYVGTNIGELGGFWWSSTQCDASTAWSMSDGIVCTDIDKTVNFEAGIIPLFKI